MATRACHWVNAYTRIRYGVLEYVCGYWRCCG